MAEAKRDGNFVPTLIAVSSADGVTPVVVYADPDTHRLLVDATGSGASPLTTKGDIYVFSSTNTRLPVGTNGQTLVADSTEVTGLKWQTGGSGTVTSVATGTGLTGGTITATGTVSLAVALQPMATMAGNSLKSLRVNVGETAVEYFTPTAVAIAVGDTVTSGTTGSVLFIGAGPVLAQDNANFFWDDTNNRLGVGTATPGFTFHSYGSTSGGHTMIERLTASTTGLSGTARFKATSSGDMADTFGPQIAFDIRDTAAVNNEIAIIAALRNGADNTGYLTFYTANAGVNSQRVIVDHSSLRPASNDHIPLGSATVSWSDLFLASGGVINFNNGDVTLTHSAGTLTLAGGTLVVPANGLTINATNVTATGTQLNYLNGATGTTGTASTNIVFSTSPTLVTPILGVATATSINKVAFTAPATGATVTIIDGKTFTVNKTITLEGTDSTIMTFPTSSATIARTDAGQTFTGVQVFTSPKILTDISDTNGNELIKFTSTASAVNEITVKNQATGSSPEIQATGGDTNIDLLLVPKGAGIVKGELHRFQVQLIDVTTAITTGTSKGGDYRIANRAITVKAVGAYVDTAATGGTLLTIDINEGGTTILSTKITLDASEKTSTTAATPAVISDSAIAADGIVTIDVDAVGNTTPGNGLKVWIDYVYA